MTARVPKESVRRKEYPIPDSQEEEYICVGEKIPVLVKKPEKPNTKT